MFWDKHSKQVMSKVCFSGDGEGGGEGSGQHADPMALGAAGNQAASLGIGHAGQIGGGTVAGATTGPASSGVFDGGSSGGGTGGGYGDPYSHRSLMANPTQVPENYYPPGSPEYTRIENLRQSIFNDPRNQDPEAGKRALMNATLRGQALDPNLRGMAGMAMANQEWNSLYPDINPSNFGIPIDGTIPGVNFPALADMALGLTGGVPLGAMMKGTNALLGAAGGRNAGVPMGVAENPRGLDPDYGHASGRVTGGNLAPLRVGTVPGQQQAQVLPTGEVVDQWGALVPTLEVKGTTLADLIAEGGA